MNRRTDAPRNPVFEPWVMNVPHKLVCYEGGPRRSDQKNRVSAKLLKRAWSVPIKPDTTASTAGEK
jgi:hypothetical protein